MFCIGSDRHDIIDLSWDDIDCVQACIGSAEVLFGFV